MNINTFLRAFLAVGICIQMVTATGNKKCGSDERPISLVRQLTGRSITGRPVKTLRDKRQEYYENHPELSAYTRCGIEYGSHVTLREIADHPDLVKLIPKISIFENDEYLVSLASADLELFSQQFVRLESIDISKAYQGIPFDDFHSRAVAAFVGALPVLKSLKAYQTSSSWVNYLNCLPGTINFLSFCWCNGLVILPPFIGSLPQLRFLHLHNNPNIVLPAVLPSSLEELNISACDLSVVPPCVKDLMRLKILYMADNTGLKFSNGCLPDSLESLAFNNCFDCTTSSDQAPVIVPSCIMALPYLKKLDFWTSGIKIHELWHNASGGNIAVGR